jgi:hypothetical protein
MIYFNLLFAVLILSACTPKPFRYYCYESPYVGDQLSFWYGHRAASTHLTDVENSIQALNHAIEDQDILNSIEFDIRTTKDDQFIIMHDPLTCRVNYEMQNVVNTDYLALAPLVNGENIPTLDDYIEVFENSDYEKIVQVEIKHVKPELISEFITRILRLKLRFEVKVMAFRYGAKISELKANCDLFKAAGINIQYIESPIKFVCD